MRTFLIAVAMLASLAGMGKATDLSSDRATLKGLSPVRVVIEDIGANSPSGLTKEVLQTDVELKLRSAGLPVSNADNGTPFLYLQLTIIPVHSAGTVMGYAYSVNLELNQSAMLVRDRSMTMTAPTWSVGGLDVFPNSGSTVQSIRDQVKENVDKFLNAYLSVNPKH